MFLVIGPNSVSLLILLILGVPAMILGMYFMVRSVVRRTAFLVLESDHLRFEVGSGRKVGWLAPRKAVSEVVDVPRWPADRGSVLLSVQRGGKVRHKRLYEGSSEVAQWLKALVVLWAALPADEERTQE